ncbi:30S ribosomal protein S12 methylthiotransferase RimO [bacterium]|nr:30S ribosomal protein S12 methylthiotransferase RimO [bacterium]
MRTRSSQKKRINVVTLGCSKNIYDSEVLMGQLKASGKDVVHEEQGEVVVINTCGFIDNAKQESIDTILHFAELKKAGKVEKVYVTGCLSERYKPELEAEIPEIDSWFGTRDLPRLLKTLGADYKQELVGQRLLTTPSHYAYLKISEGCDRPCSFCAIPLMRGSHRSTPIEDLVNQTRTLAAKGVKELMLIAQDLTYYGLDLYGKRDLARLLRAMAEVDGIEWIRLHYLFPTGFPEDILEVVREEPKLCRYADIPLQHISDAVLKSMRRGTTQGKTEALIEKMRNQVPGIALRTTLIVGYPGETERDFQTLYDWVERSRFDRLGVFTYSHEENTHAYTLTDDVPEEVKRERLEAIMDLQRGISWELNQVRVGQELEVLIDRAETGVFVGRTEFDSPDVDNEVHIVPPANTHLRIGDFVRARITEAEEYDLKGALVD